MTDMVGSRTLRSQWDETVRCYGRAPFLEYISVDDQVTVWTYEEMDRKVKQAANFFLELGVARQELVAETGGVYNCPVPAEVLPPVPAGVAQRAKEAGL